MVVVLVVVDDVGGVFALYAFDPGCRFGRLLKVEGPRAENFVEGDVAEVALDDARLGLDGVHDVAQVACLVRLQQRYLVKQHYVAELNLVDDKGGEVALLLLLIGIADVEQVLAVAKFLAEAQGVNHGDNRVKDGHTLGRVGGVHPRHHGDGLGNGRRVAYSAGLDDDVVELAGLRQVGQLLHQVGLERAADAAVRQGHQVVVVAAVALTYHAALLHQVGVNIHLAQVVDYHGKAIAFLVIEDAVQQRCLSAAEITRQQQHGYLYFAHWCMFLAVMYVIYVIYRVYAVYVGMECDVR